jgi:hypothetical protein
MMQARPVYVAAVDLSCEILLKLSLILFMLI